MSLALSSETTSKKTSSLFTNRIWLKLAIHCHTHTPHMLVQKCLSDHLTNALKLDFYNVLDTLIVPQTKLIFPFTDVATEKKGNNWDFSSIHLNTYVCMSMSIKVCVFNCMLVITCSFRTLTMLKVMRQMTEMGILQTMKSQLL